MYCPNNFIPFSLIILWSLILQTKLIVYEKQNIKIYIGTAYSIYYNKSIHHMQFWLSEIEFKKLIKSNLFFMWEAYINDHDRSNLMVFFCFRDVLRLFFFGSIRGKRNKSNKLAIINQREFPLCLQHLSGTVTFLTGRCFMIHVIYYSRDLPCSAIACCRKGHNMRLEGRSVP